MNRKQLYWAKDYTYEARQKKIGWLNKIIESLHEQPELGKYEDDEDSEELFTQETITVAQHLMKLVIQEEPNKQDIRELYILLKIYKHIRNSAWDDICKYVEKWHWLVNIWETFQNVIELDIWHGCEYQRYSIKEPLITEGKYIRGCYNIGQPAHIVFKLERNLENNQIKIIWQIPNETDDEYISDSIEGIIDGLIKYSHLENKAFSSLKIIVFNGSYHEYDCRESDYRIAALIAWRNALENAEFIPL
ncbi:elongation factor EF-G [Calothrix sp. NIES-4101]|nr:elongation factor EF-G [Calothrix sp. NIES-4101]